MVSIRNYERQIRLCKRCGQPCYYDQSEPSFKVWMHFQEQWDGARCSYHPMADELGEMGWDEEALEALKATYDGRGWEFRR